MEQTRPRVSFANAHSRRSVFARRKPGSQLRQCNCLSEEFKAISFAQCARKRALCMPLSCRGSVVDVDTANQRSPLELLQSDTSAFVHASFRTFEACASYHRGVRAPSSECCAVAGIPFSQPCTRVLDYLQCHVFILSLLLPARLALSGASSSMLQHLAQHRLMQCVRGFVA